MSSIVLATVEEAERGRPRRHPFASSEDEEESVTHSLTSPSMIRCGDDFSYFLVFFLIIVLTRTSDFLEKCEACSYEE